jgi:SagB-type dehydrogenase family enzyme
MTTATRWTLGVAILVVSAAITAAVAQLATAPSSQPASQPAVALPPPKLAGGMSLDEALATRRSVRRFTSTALTAEQIGQLCWAAQGVTEPKRGLRTAPSAMARYPLELYVVTAEGVQRYVPASHALQMHLEGDGLARLRESAGRQPAVAQAPAVFVFAAAPSRMGGRAPERMQRWIDFEVGHAAQNLLLEAVALGLGGVPVGGFNDAAVAEAIKLPEGQQVCYLIPIGEPAK